MCRRDCHHHHHHVVRVLLALALIALPILKPVNAAFVISGQQQDGQQPHAPSSRELTRTTALHASRSRPSSPSSRRSFVTSVAASIATSSLLVVVEKANAIDIKVTPMAHTFVTSTFKGKGIVKPTRENDFTRFLTNAKVVLLFSGGGGGGGGEQEVTRLTQERKIGQGPGVTPGNIVISSAKKASSLEKEVSSLGKGDTLIVTVPSTSFAGDKKAAADSATSLGLFLGGAREGGVVSVLVDGSKSVAIEESGYDLLWYSLSR